MLSPVLFLTRIAGALRRLAARSNPPAAEQAQPLHPAPQGLIETDMKAVITGANHAAASLLARDLHDLLGTPLASLIASPDRRAFQRRACELIENPDSGEWQTRIIRNNSVIAISVALSIEPVPGPTGAPRAMRWFIRDLRPLRRAQSEAMAREEQRYGRQSPAKGSRRRPGSHDDWARSSSSPN
jgi:PAS domain-containing protein